MLTGEPQDFSLGEPQPIGINTRYAFWLTASEERYFRAIRRVGCVASVSTPQDNRALVEIRNDHDPDEAWHWVRTELEETRRHVVLDPIWEDALWLL